MHRSVLVGNLRRQLHLWYLVDEAPGVVRTELFERPLPSQEAVDDAKQCGAVIDQGRSTRVRMPSRRVGSTT